MSPLWLSRPLLNWQNVYAWGMQVGIKKMVPPDQLHVTLATVRQPVQWDDLELQSDTLVVRAGPKVVQIFGYTLKGQTFKHSGLMARHAELLQRFPQIDHPRMRPHVTLFRGGKMPSSPYLGELVFGPESSHPEAARRPMFIERLIRGLRGRPGNGGWMIMTVACAKCGHRLNFEADVLSRDCGGDCWGCVGKIEADGGWPPSVAAVLAEIARGLRNKDGWPIQHG